MQKGKIIFLNGVSSAGKSTLTKCLQMAATEPYYAIAQDTFTSAIAPNYKGKFDGEKLNDLWLDAISAMHHTIKLYSDLGHNVVVDHVLTRFTDEDGKSDPSLEECAKLLCDYPAWLIKVECSIEALRRREIERGDRAPGTAEWQMQYLAPKDGYDLSVSTSEKTAEQCAEDILSWVSGNAPWAFREINEGLLRAD